MFNQRLQPTVFRSLRDAAEARAVIYPTKQKEVVEKQ